MMLASSVNEPGASRVDLKRVTVNVPSRQISFPSTADIDWHVAGHLPRNAGGSFSGGFGLSFALID